MFHKLGTTMVANARITQEVHKDEEEAEGQEGEKDEQQ